MNKIMKAETIFLVFDLFLFFQCLAFIKRQSHERLPLNPRNPWPPRVSKIRILLTLSVRKVIQDHWALVTTIYFTSGQSLQMIICKRSNPLDDHLQEAGSSPWSFASGQILRIIICKWPVNPDDHLQGLFFFQMIICKRPDPPDDQLQEAGSSKSLALTHPILSRFTQSLDDFEP